MFGEYMFLFAPQQVGISYKVKKAMHLHLILHGYIGTATTYKIEKRNSFTWHVIPHHVTTVITNTPAV